MSNASMQEELEAAGYEILSHGIFPGDKAYIFRYESDIIYGFEETTEQAYAYMKKQVSALALAETASEIIKEADEFSLWLFGQLPENVESEGIQTIEIDIAKIVKLKKLFEPTE